MTKKQKKGQKGNQTNRPLTDKQKAFVECYLQCWNASEAARLSGYSVSTAGAIGHENLKKPEIKAAINARMAELKMGADEVLIRLAEHARADMLDFVDTTGQIDIETARANQRGRLVKKYKRTVKTFSGEHGDRVEEHSEIELHDAQAALIVLGKHHKLFTEKVLHGSDPDNPLPNVTSEMMAKAEAELREWIEKMDKAASGLNVSPTSDTSLTTTA